jgi:glycyl-tRNA synthetase alpha subunit
MAITFTIEEIKTYILSQDSLGDVLYNLTEEKIIKANELKEEEEEDEWEEEDD